MPVAELDMVAGEGRGPPHHRLEGLVGEGLHVGIAARELGAVDFPVALGRLPAVVEHGPFEAERLGLGAARRRSRRW
ncbi:hypothetical protein KX816_01465 [Sphingosinicellaceae bacterium]|nr:hypothetical protein KX816_01465 [Sphingosinicellaceae bacterium]